MTKKITSVAMFACVALLCSYIEMMIPNPFAMQGIKLGLANSVVLFSIYYFSFREAYMISVVRVVLVSLLFGSFFSLAFSLAGCTISMIAMYLAYRSKLFSIVGNSIIGAVFHNIGQLLVAMILLESISVIYYFVGLLISGVISGCFIGLLCQKVVKQIKRQ